MVLAGGAAGGPSVRAGASEPQAAPAPAPSADARERLLYSFTLREETAEGTLECSGTLVLVLDHGDEEARSLQASVEGLVLHHSKADVSALASDVAGASVTFRLAEAGALMDLAVDEGTGPDATRLWEQLLGRWQVTSYDSDSSGWMALEPTEVGTGRCQYRRQGLVLERQLVGYTRLKDPRQLPGGMAAGTATITADDLPLTVDGTEDRRSTRMIRSRSTLTYTYRRLSRTDLVPDAS